MGTSPYTQEVATENIRTIVYDRAVKQIAEPIYKFKQAVSIVPTSAWVNYFYREDTTVLSGATGNATKGIPRGANFPQAVAAWERVFSVIEKYGLEDNIQWEDIISDQIDVRDRTLYKIAQGVTKAVDDEIFDALTERAFASSTPPSGSRMAVVGNIQKLEINMGTASGAAWTQSSAAIIDNLLQAKQLIAEKNYDTTNLMCFVSPKGYRLIMNYLAEKGAQFPAIGNEVASNGRQGTVAGVQLVVSNSVCASMALVVVPKVCGTWKELVPLQTTTVEDPYKSVKVRSVEMGTTQLTDPKAVVVLYGTERS